MHSLSKEPALRQNGVLASPGEDTGLKAIVILRAQAPQGRGMLRSDTCSVLSPEHTPEARDAVSTLTIHRFVLQVLGAVCLKHLLTAGWVERCTALESRDHSSYELSGAATFDLFPPVPHLDFARSSEVEHNLPPRDPLLDGHARLPAAAPLRDHIKLYVVAHDECSRRRWRRLHTVLASEADGCTLVLPVHDAAHLLEASRVRSRAKNEAERAGTRLPSDWSPGVYIPTGVEARDRLGEYDRS